MGHKEEIQQLYMHGKSRPQVTKFIVKDSSILTETWLTLWSTKEVTISLKQNKNIQLKYATQ